LLNKKCNDITYKLAKLKAQDKSLNFDYYGDFSKNDHEEGYEAYGAVSWEDAADMETDALKKIQFLS